MPRASIPWKKRRVLRGVGGGGGADVTHGGLREERRQHRTGGVDLQRDAVLRVRHPRVRPRAACRATRDACRARATACRASRARPPSPAGFLTAFRPDRPVPTGATRSIRSARPPYAPTGRPPPMILPRQVRSGLMPYNACGAARRRAEAGNDFVEDQHRAFGACRACAARRGSRRPARRRPCCLRAVRR